MGGAAFLVIAALAACTVDSDVQVESRSVSRTADSSIEANLEEAASTTTTAPAAPPEPTATLPQTDRPTVVFDLERFDLEVAWTPTRAETPPGGYNGFHTAVQLDDGTFMASGFDAWGDGEQAERSALWRSSDGEYWERIAIDSVSAAPDQQSIVSLIVGNGSVRAYGAFLDTFTFPSEFDSVGRWTTNDEGDTWTSFETLRGSYANRGYLVDGRFITVGTADANTPGGFSGQVTIETSDQFTRERSTDVDPAGDVVTGSGIRDLLVRPDEWLITGGTTITDPGALGSEWFVDSYETDFPSDVGLWSSADDGMNWERLDIDSFAGVEGAQHGERLRWDGERYWLLTTSQQAGVLGVDLYTSPDARSWSLHPYRRPDFPEADDFTASRDLFLVEGAVVVIDEVYGPDPQLMMTVIDPETDEVVSIDVTAELGGLHQVEDIIQLEGRALGFGRVERGVSESDLQVIDVRRIEAEQEPDEPATTTTVPSDGGSSDA